jgi:hypothetical protein
LVKNSLAAKAVSLVGLEPVIGFCVRLVRAATNQRGHDGGAAAGDNQRGYSLANECSLCTAIVLFWDFANLKEIGWGLGREIRAFGQDWPLIE